MPPFVIGFAISSQFKTIPMTAKITDTKMESRRGARKSIKEFRGIAEELFDIGTYFGTLIPSGFQALDRTSGEGSQDCNTTTTWAITPVT
jgi:hypothetical protein